MFEHGESGEKCGELDFLRDIKVKRINVENSENFMNIWFVHLINRGMIDVGENGLDQGENSRRPFQLWQRDYYAVFLTTFFIIL